MSPLPVGLKFALSLRFYWLTSVGSGLGGLGLVLPAKVIMGPHCDPQSRAPGQTPMYWPLLDLSLSFMWMVVPEMPVGTCLFPSGESKSLEKLSQVQEEARVENPWQPDPVV